MNATIKSQLFEMINPQWYDFLQQRYKLKLKPAGKNHWVVNCPFHQESTASGHVMMADAYYNYPRFKCFGCGEFYNPIDFVMAIEGLSYIEACKILGGYVGMEITSEPKNPKHEAYKEKMDEHVRRYARCLPTNPTIYDYLTKERGLTEETLQRFMVGAVPSDEFKYRSDMSGIADRIAFPILEHKLPNEAKCVGMGYRTLADRQPNWDKAKDPKYRNDHSQTGDLEGVFVKGDLLYGYPMAFQAIRKNQYAILVEGYVDVLSLHQSGIHHSVGIMGTSFTERQMDALRALTSNIILFLDGDKAGVTHMLSYVQPLIQKGFSVKIIKAEDNKDPADICKAFKFVRSDVSSYILRTAEPALNMMINTYASDYEKIVVKERMKALNAVLPVIEQCSPAERMIYESMLLKRLDVK